MPGVPNLQPRDFLYLAPEIILATWGLLVLIADFGFLRRWPGPRRNQVLGWLTIAGAVAAAASLYVELPTLRFKSASPGASSQAEIRKDGPATPAVQAETSGGLLARTAIEDRDPRLFFGTISGDDLTRVMNYVVLALMALVVGLSMSWNFTEHWGEYYALMIWAAVGMMLLIASEELLVLFLTLEMMTLCLYMMTAFEKDRRRSAEGGLKYFVYGSVSSALFLFGLSLLYGLTGSTRLDAIAMVLQPPGMAVGGLEGNVAGALAVLLILVGFGFKLAAVPFHQWAPDAYEGAPAPVTAWIASGSKLASVIAMMKVLIVGLQPWSRLMSPQGAGSPDTPGWVGIVAVIAAASMTFGNFAALAQRNLKRMLAYSSIAHAGYILVGVIAAAVAIDPNGARLKDSAGSVLFYLVVYSFTTVGAFALAVWLIRDKQSDEIEDLNGLGARSPLLAVCIVLLMLSLIGMPPLAGFFGKLYMFMEALRTGERDRLTLTWLVALGLINSVVSAFYYVRVLKAMFLRPEQGRLMTEPPAGIRWSIIAATVVAVGFGIFPAPLLDSMSAAAMPMLTPGRFDDDEAKARNPYATGRDPNARPLSPEEQRRLREENTKRLQGTGGPGSSPPPPGAPGARRKGASRKGAPRSNPAPKSKSGESS
jgi:NADH-quinone oxidoreductase subunit N